jgi:hypothetical protein
LKIYDHIIIGDGPVSRYFIYSRMKTQTFNPSKVLIIDAGKGLRALNERTIVKSNIDYGAFKRQPSFHSGGSDFYWAGGCQGWPEEHFSKNFGDNGLPVDSADFYFRSKLASDALGFKNFDFSVDKPRIYLGSKVIRNNHSIERIYAKITNDPFLKRLKLNEQIDTLHNFVVTSIEPSKGLLFVHGFDYPSLQEIIITTREVYVANGTFEATRLILNSKNFGLKFNEKFTGKYLSDHLSLPFAEYTTDNLDFFLRYFEKHKTVDQNYIWPRLKLQNKGNKLASPSFCHLDRFTYNNNVPLAFKIQRRIGMQNLLKFGQNSGSFWLNLFVEKENDKKNRITISQDTEHLIPLLNVEFNITEKESKKLVEIGQVYEDTLKTMCLISRVFTEDITDRSVLLRSISAGTHPSGTIRMGRTPSDGVVNRKLELWSHPNVKILGSAVFPRASATHPTFPAMILSQFSQSRCTGEN